MIPLAGLRGASHPGVGSGEVRGFREQSNRRGQDRSRNVRPVGCGEIRNNDKDLGHIPPCPRTLPIRATRRICLAFCTLRPLA